MKIRNIKNLLFLIQTLSLCLNVSGWEAGRWYIATHDLDMPTWGWSRFNVEMGDVIGIYGWISRGESPKVYRYKYKSSIIDKNLSIYGYEDYYWCTKFYDVDWEDVTDRIDNRISKDHADHEIAMRD